MLKKEALAVPTSILQENGIMPAEITNGYSFKRIESVGELRHLLSIAKNKGEYKPRYGTHDIDKDPSYQQIIVYGVVARRDGKFLLYQRSTDKKRYNEARLSGKISVGIGGHMEPTDLSLPKSFYREIEEEAKILVDGKPIKLRDDKGELNVKLMKQYIKIRPIGLIKDERDDVGKVHFGLACMIETKANNVDIQVKTGKEEENIFSEYVTPEEFKTRTKSGQIEAEGWADIVFREELSKTN
jgi:predicted NUDIX family phosphoesterase